MSATSLLPAICSILLTAGLLAAEPAPARLRTWDGRHAIDQIAVTMVYFVPRDRQPLVDWRERVDYFAQRIQQFHTREFQGQSQLAVTVHAEPLVSERTTAELREGDGDAIFFRTLREADEQLEFGRDPDGPFPILLVLSEINWRPLDDFYRLKPGPQGPEFEGNYTGQEHFPGAASGGARATYLARERKGWGLVSADGWRVPYRGADCVVYHEGCGHTVGLPHPEPGNNSVMSLGQYHGWISESWLDRDQKVRLGWTPPDEEPDLAGDLFSQFRALPDPPVPQPGQVAALRFDWPARAKVAALQVRYQTDVCGPWIDAPVEIAGDKVDRVTLATFDRPIPVSYRVNATLTDGRTAELWGYFQVRKRPDQTVLPRFPLAELLDTTQSGGTDPIPNLTDEIDLLATIDPERDAVQGEWQMVDGKLESGKSYGARIEIAAEVPDEYELTVIAEPLDPPNALLLGQVLSDRRFAVLCNYQTVGGALSALENVDGRNVGNPTTRTGLLFQVGRLSTVQVQVRSQQVRVSVDGARLIDWQGEPARLSLSDYWSTSHNDRLFLGAYDCRYRIHRVTLRPLGPAQ